MAAPAEYASAAQHSHGSYIQYCATANGTFVPVAEVMTIEDGFEKSEYKRTHLLSPNRIQEYAPGLRDPGTVPVKANHTPAAYATLLGLHDAIYYWQIVDNDGGITAFTGWVKSLKKTTPDDGPVTIDFTIRKTSIITYTAPTGGPAAVTE